MNKQIPSDVHILGYVWRGRYTTKQYNVGITIINHTKPTLWEWFIPTMYSDD